jgi:glucose-1-phosphate adenylyltransferase
LREVLKYHESNHAKITVVSTSQEFDDTISPSDAYEVSADEYGNVTSYVRLRNVYKCADISTNMVVIDRGFLLEQLIKAMSVVRSEISGMSDFYYDVINSSIGKHTVKKYRYDGVFMRISSLSSYFGASMKLLLPKVRNELFSDPERPIYTKVRNTPPTHYTETSCVRSSYIADGCFIEGSVENSILFRGVTVGRGSIVKNSILLQDSCVSENVYLNCVIADKNVTVKNGRNLSGHESIPFFLSKGTTV